MTRIAAPVPWRLHRDRLLPLTAPRALEAAAQLPQAPPASRAAVVARARPRVGPPPCRPRRSPAAEPPPLWHPSRFSTGPPARGVTVLRSPPSPPSTPPHPARAAAKARVAQLLALAGRVRRVRPNGAMRTPLLSPVPPPLPPSSFPPPGSLRPNPVTRPVSRWPGPCHPLPVPEQAVGRHSADSKRSIPAYNPRIFCLFILAQFTKAGKTLYGSPTRSAPCPMPVGPAPPLSVRAHVAPKRLRLRILKARRLCALRLSLPLAFCFSQVERGMPVGTCTGPVGRHRPTHTHWDLGPPLTASRPSLRAIRVPPIFRTCCMSKTPSPPSRFCSLLGATRVSST